jgi:hypothetical protein
MDKLDLLKIDAEMPLPALAIRTGHEKGLWNTAKNGNTLFQA